MSETPASPSSPRLRGTPTASHFQMIASCVNRLLSGEVAEPGVAFVCVDAALDRNLYLVSSASEIQAIQQDIEKNISRCLPPHSVLSRISDTHLVAVTPGVATSQDARALCRAILNGLHEPLTLGGVQYIPQGSAGFSLFPAHGRSPEILLRSAHIAGAAAARGGRDCVVAFEPGLERQAADDVHLEIELSRAISHSELSLAFQPKVNLATGLPCGAEALLRWRGQSASPAQFIAVAERSALICDIGRWVLQEACQVAVRWQEAGYDLPISVNVSSRQFAEPDFPASVEAVLKRTGCAPRLIELELTEGVMLADPCEAADMIRKIGRLGVRVAIDDFGTGFSSLSYLKKLPVAAVKIDRTFVVGLPGDPQNLAICKAIIPLIQALGMTVIAEGVEDEAGVACLASLGCDQIQGYFFLPPAPEPEFLEWMARRRPQRRRLANTSAGIRVVGAALGAPAQAQCAQARFEDQARA